MDTVSLVLLIMLRTQSGRNALLKQELEVKVLALYAKYSFPYYLNFIYTFIEHLLGVLCAWAPLRPHRYCGGEVSPCSGGKNALSNEKIRSLQEKKYV